MKPHPFRGSKKAANSIFSEGHTEIKLHKAVPLTFELIIRNASAFVNAIKQFPYANQSETSLFILSISFLPVFCYNHIGIYARDFYIDTGAAFAMSIRVADRIRPHCT